MENQLLQDLDAEIKRHKERLQEIFQILEWDPDLITEPSDQLLQCSINGHHWVPAQRLEIHEKRCQLKIVTPMQSLEERLRSDDEFIQANSKKAPSTLNPGPTEAPAIQEKKEKELDTLRELQLQRDLKRRRTAYRKQGLHTGRKTKTEKMRDLIQSMMETLPSDG